MNTPEPRKPERDERMDEETRLALEAIDAAVAWKPPEGPIVLSDEYLALVEQAEALPQNRAGTDKTWTERVLLTWKWELRNAREILPE